MRNFSKRQLKILAILLMITVAWGICYSIQSPFYPRAAEYKGASPAQYGFVFGIYQLIRFLVSPIYGHIIASVGSKFMLVAGSFITGSTGILLGVLIYVNSSSAFLTLSFLVKITEGFGVAGILTSSFTIVSREFPDNVGAVMSTIETSRGVGLIIGPALGGILYEVGGYVMPFALLGAFLAFTSIVALFCLPRTDDVVIHRRNREGARISVLTLLKIPDISISMLGVFVAANNIGFIQTSLEPHIRFLNLSPLALGAIFVIFGGAYATLSPVWGILCDRNINTKLLTFLGASCSLIAFIFIGPAPFIQADTSLWLVSVSLALNGIGIGGELITGFTGSNARALEAGLPRNVSTLGLVSGLYGSVLALGAFIGPSVAGLLVDTYGFRFATLYISFLHIIVAILNIISLCYGALMRGSHTIYLSTENSDDEEETARLEEATSKSQYGAMQSCEAVLGATKQRC